MIQLNNIYKNYLLGQYSVAALKEISLAIQKGEFICIAGSSGSGKTTLLNIIGCLDKQSSGTYSLNDNSVDRIPEKELYKIRKQLIGFIFQNFNLIPVLTAYENIEYPLILDKGLSPKQREEMVNHVLNEVGIYDRRDHKPDQLSGGQRQRVAIARALVKQPPLILADEPTANLDSKTGQMILELMQKINQENQVTFIFSSHDHEIMKLSRRVVVLKDGEIIEDSTERSQTHVS